MIRRPHVVSFAAAIAALQLWLADHFYGFLTGDEVEVLGEAFRLATGFDYGTWDVRNTLVADVFVAPLIWLATHLGITAPSALIVIATIPFALASALTIVLVYELAQRWGANALVATLLFALHWLPLGFGSTTYPRVIAMCCITAAALLIERPWIAGALMGVAFADRYSEIVYLIPLLILARRRAWQVAAGALASIAITSGVFEWIRWGEPFAALRKFARLTLVEQDFASRIKQQSPLWYLETLPRWCALTMLPLLWYARRFWAFVLIPLVLLSLIAHKEVRYLQGIIPFLAILAGLGFRNYVGAAALSGTATAEGSGRHKVAIALVALSVVWNLWGLRFLQRESRPAVAAARSLVNARTVAISQPWACGDKLYLARGARALELGTPAQYLDELLPQADAVIIYESDVTAEVAAKLSAFRRTGVFRAPRARDVIVYVRSGS
ncbi:MAG TPA: hypothetical protein VKB93_18115 [Thermoanaerobaculia bacterium]|nr:hypothetical protein [Thermoanaerobaculia bacterium]